MSLIGPRPDLPDAVEIYRDGEEKKLSVLPGITGYSQAYHRNLIDLHERFAEDVYYAEHVSFALDVKIFFQTIKTVLLRKGVYREESGKTVVEKK
jgi:lipopolysaccharide/colanic/teichoic acid biosynthesis glycosyltransferase